jgi:septal ring factor EnvC (AmiA/AmiB activator)
MDEYKLCDRLEAAQEELVRLIEQRERLEWRISKLQTDIVHLAALCGVEVVDPMKQLGLTDVIRWIFARSKDTPLSAKQVTEAVTQSHLKTSEYKNLPANVRTIVKRLVKAQEVIVEPVNQLAAGDPKFKWAGGLPPLPPSLTLIEKVRNLKEEK